MTKSQNGKQNNGQPNIGPIPKQIISLNIHFGLLLDHHPRVAVQRSFTFLSENGQKNSRFASFGDEAEWLYPPRAPKTRHLLHAKSHIINHCKCQSAIYFFPKLLVGPDHDLCKKSA